MPKTRSSAKPEDEAFEKDDELIEVMSQEEVPRFQSEEELDAFWSTHSVGETYLARTGLSREPRGPSMKVRRVLGSESDLPPTNGS